MAQSKIKRQNLDRIRKWIKSVQSRGYYVDEELIANLSSYSTQKLKALTLEKLYAEHATYITEEGKELGGRTGRSIERTQSGKKAAATRKANKESFSNFVNSGIVSDNSSFDNLTRDGFERISKEDYEVDEETGEIINKPGSQRRVYADPLSDNEPDVADDYEITFVDNSGSSVAKGDIILKNFEDLLAQYTTKGKDYLNNMLKSEISRFGRDAVAEALSLVPEELITAAQRTVFYLSKMASDESENNPFISGDEVHRTLKELAELIKDSILTREEAKGVGSAFD